MIEKVRIVRPSSFRQLLCIHFASAALTATASPVPSVAGVHHDLREVGAIVPHRLGEPGLHRLAGRVVGAVQEQHGIRELAAVLARLA